ncbi:MAG: phytanoyl-CoA dioxygenase family protein [Bacteroidota bacterium]|jgi:ectoine hydroxylase-related dioxygenase (phytanoyl-CoA dioxygenase family)
MNATPESVKAALDANYSVTPAQVKYFSENGFIKIKNIFEPTVIDYMNIVISKEVDRLNNQQIPLEERDTYGKAFLQIMNLWTHTSAVKDIVFSKKIAQIATGLMQTAGVRLYHDQALFKEPKGGHTPWHADQYYWPLATENTVTAWIPLQATPLNYGPLEFSAGSNKLTAGRDKQISDESQAFLEAELKRNAFNHVVEPFDVGEISFHRGWLYHRAGPNVSGNMRKVMTMIYMDKDTVLKTPENHNQQADWDTWCPGATVGEIVNTPLNPVLYEAV